MEITHISVTSGQIEHSPLVSHICIGIGHGHGDEIFAIIRISERESITRSDGISRIRSAFFDIETDLFVGDSA
jgi:hypothetical protein